MLRGKRATAPACAHSTTPYALSTLREGEFRQKSSATMYYKVRGVCSCAPQVSGAAGLCLNKLHCNFIFRKPNRKGVKKRTDNEPSARKCSRLVGRGLNGDGACRPRKIACSGASRRGSGFLPVCTFLVGRPSHLCVCRVGTPPAGNHRHCKRRRAQVTQTSPNS